MISVRKFKKVIFKKNQCTCVCENWRPSFYRLNILIIFEIKHRLGVHLSLYIELAKTLFDLRLLICHEYKA